MLAYKEVLTLIAILLTFVAFVPYILLIFKGRVKPHVFSWIIWSITTLTVFVAQWDDGAGFAAWSTGISGCVTVFIALLAYIKRAEITITKTDWTFLVAAMISLSLWFITSDAVWTVIILTAIDLMAFGPTIRKTFVMHYSESIIFFAIFSVRDALVVLALEHYSLVTVLFPASISIACILVIVMMLYRRKTIISAV